MASPNAFASSLPLSLRFRCLAMSSKLNGSVSAWFENASPCRTTMLYPPARNDWTSCRVSREYPLDDSAIAPGSAQILSARSRQPQPDRQPLFLKTRSSHYLLHVAHCAINHNEVLVHGDTLLRLAPSNGIPCFELIVISVTLYRRCRSAV